tara:strand:- start:5551 stop:6576 length:1026 start_codon:yes stop_codon:yes gene_type:complete
MANVNIRKPRFYVDLINYEMSRGSTQDGTYDVVSGTNLIHTFQTGSEAELFDMKPLNQVDWDTSAATGNHVLVNIDTESTGWEHNFIAILNHNMVSADAKFRIGASNTEAHINNEDFAAGHTAINPDGVINASVGGSAPYAVTPTTDGDTIVTFSNSSLQYWGIQFEGDGSGTFSGANDLKIGCILMGQYYDMPNSPDLSVKRSITFDAVNMQESLGGQRYATMTNHGRHASGTSKSPFQTNTNRWGSHGGRMSYDMKFSYLASTDVMPDNYASIDRDDDAVIEDVWNMTNGRHLPFIFTTDGTSTAESDYLFARFGQDSLKMTQVAPDVFDVSMKIEEEF